MSSRTRLLLTLIALFTASIAVRAWWSDLDAPLISGDEQEYHFLANQLIEGNGFTGADGSPTAWRTPGFPFFLAVIYTLTGSDPAYARMASIVVSSLTAPLIFLLVFRLWQKRSTALSAAAIWVFLPTSIYLSGSLLAESLAAFLIAAAFLVAAAFCAENGRFPIAGGAFSGLLIGAAVLSRGYLIFAIAILPLYFVFSRRSKKLGAICLAFSALLPALWIARNGVMLRSPTLSTEAAQVIWHGNNRWSRGTWNGEWFNADSGQRQYLVQKYPGFFDDLSETERARIYIDETAMDVLTDPWRVLSLIPRKLFFFLTPYSYMGLDWLYMACIPFALAGALLVLRQREKRELSWFLILPIVSVGAISVLTFGDPRFRHPVDLCFVVLAAIGITALATTMKTLVSNPHSAVLGLPTSKP